MYAVTTLQGTLLGLAVLAVTTLLMLSVLRGFPRAIRTIDTVVYCPLLRRMVTAELDRDEWTQRCVDVARCSVLGVPGTVGCTKACLSRAAQSL